MTATQCQYADARRVSSRSTQFWIFCGAAAGIRPPDPITLYCIYIHLQYREGGSVAEWLACWTEALKGPGSNRSHDAVG